MISSIDLQKWKQDGGSMLKDSLMIGKQVLQRIQCIPQMQEKVSTSEGLEIHLKY